MKQILAVTLVLILMTTMLTACVFSPLVGTWSATIAGAEGQMTLRRDGTGEILSNDITRPCRWVATEETLTVIQEVDGVEYTFLDEVSYTVTRRALTVTSKSGNTLTFTKK